MKAADIGFFKSFLLSQKGTILNKANELKTTCFQQMDGVTDEAEVASRDISVNMSLHLHERDRSEQLRIEKALGKIETGTYGQCEACGDDIGLGRLKAQPYAEFCIHCMEDLEDPRNLLN